MRKIYYSNCSELVADFCIQDPEVFYPLIKDLGKRYKWQFDPQLSLELLKGMTFNKERERSVLVIDMKGRKTLLNYGSNGYDDSLGFWLADPGNNDYDVSQYPFFAAAVDECQAEMQTYDGGHQDSFNEWYEKTWLPRLIKKHLCRKKPKNSK